MEGAKRILHVGCPNLGHRALFDRLVNEMFDRRWFSNNGELVQQLESKLSEFLNVKHCILVCNATVGLQIACHALELTGEVILPSYTFVATAHAVQWERLTPVFADVNPQTHTIDPASIEARVTNQTSAILGVHVWGMPCDTSAIDQIANRYGLATMYDAAHAFGCRHQGKMIGNFGNCEVFSFHATKFFNTFEGGAITTNDDELARKIRLMKNFGFSGIDSVVHLGTNGKMPEICAAMGLSCFAVLDDILAANRANYELYWRLLHDVPGIRMLNYDQHEGTNWQYIILEISEAFGRSRDELVAHLFENQIRARRYFNPGCHRMEPYISLYGSMSNSLTVSETLCRTVVCLPTGTAVDAIDIQRVCSKIVEFGKAGN